MKYLKSSIPDPSKTHTKNGWSWSHDLWPGIPGLWSRSRDCDPWSHIPGYDPAMAASLQGALKVAIEKCDCFIVWLNEEYFESNYCQAELLYARKLGKIILPFGVYSKIKDLLKGDFEFLVDLHLYDPSTSSFFEVLRRIDEALFNFEMLTIQKK